MFRWFSPFFFESEECFFCSKYLYGGCREAGKSLEASCEGDESCADKWSDKEGDVGCGGVHVCFYLVFKGVDLVFDGLEGMGKRVLLFRVSGECVPGGESFGEEVCGLYEIVEGVDHLYELEVV